jgi:hypothetical protein
VAVVALGAATFAPSSADASTTYRVVGTGDSILAMITGVDILAPGGALLTADTWVHVEYGRQPYVAGMLGHSTASIWPLVLSRSQPGGWIIIQDNGLGTSFPDWERLMRRIVDDTPNDRCLLFVPPVFHPAFNPDLATATATYAQIQASVAREAGMGGQCYRTIPWNVTALADQSYVCDPGVTPVLGFAMPADVENHQPSRCDGQHPSRRGQVWLGRWIGATVGWV